MKKIYLILAFLMVISIPTIHAISFSIDEVYPTDLGVNKEIVFSDLMVKYYINDQDLEVAILALVTFGPNTSKYTDNITISLFTLNDENIANDLSVDICEGYNWNNKGFRDFYIDCSEKVRNIVVQDKKDRWMNSITFFLKDSEEYQSFTIKINYTLSDFIIRNGDYHIAWFRNNCWGKWIKCPEKIPVFITLPSNFSVLESFSEDLRIENRDEDGRWVLFYESKNIPERSSWQDAIVWYRDIREINQEKFKWFVLGIILSLVGAALLPSIKIVFKSLWKEVKSSLK